MLKLKLIPIGESLGVVLPEGALARLQVGEGDSICLTADKEGFRITRLDLRFENTVDSAGR